MHSFSKSAGGLLGSPMFKMLARVQELERSGRNIIHFEIGDPDFNTPSHIIDSAIKALKNGQTHYANSSGLAELREAICCDTERNLNWRPDSDQVVVAPAISFIYFVLRTLVNPGEEVIISDPGYSSYFSVFSFVSVKAVNVPIFEKNGFQLKAEDLEKVVTPRSRLLILNSPHNPTGSIISKKNLKEIYEVARRHNIYILSDEVYAKMVYEKKHNSISSFDPCRELVIILNSFSKTYAMTGWRLGYVIAPVEIAEKLGLMVQTVISSVSPFIQFAGVSALNGNQNIVQQMMKEYGLRRQAIVNGFNSLPGVSCLMPDGAFYAFPNISQTGLTSKQFADKMLEEAGVALLPGTDFGQQGEGYVRVTFAISLDNIKEGLLKMKKVLTK